MRAIVTAKDNKKEAPVELVDAQPAPVIDSNFRLIIVAALRTKQLLHGSRPRINADPLKRRNTSIALEETRRGLVPFRLVTKEIPVVVDVVP
jgi:DNA-directed RNA polymerase omega subunit